MAGKRVALVSLGLIATIAFVALGLWQVERRAWKLDLIARVDARVHQPAERLPPPQQWPAINERDDAYRHVHVEGTFIHGCETPVQALTERGAGFWILTPLETGDGIVLVNRGFVPNERREPASRPASRIDGPVAVSGLLRMSEPKGAFLRSNDPKAGRWYSRDVEAIARSCGIARAAPFFIDADAAPGADGLPIGGLTVIAFRNSHFVYAVTWFVLAAMSAFGTGLVVRAKVVR